LVRDASKSSEKYLKKLEQDNFYITSAQEHATAKKLFSQHLEICE